MRAQRVPGVTEEVFTDLRESELRQIFIISIHAAPRLVQFDNGNAIRGRGCLLGEAAGHLAVQSL